MLSSVLPDEATTTTNVNNNNNNSNNNNNNGDNNNINNINEDNNYNYNNKIRATSTTTIAAISTETLPWNMSRDDADLAPWKPKMPRWLSAPLLSQDNGADDTGRKHPVSPPWVEDEVDYSFRPNYDGNYTHFRQPQEYNEEEV